MSGVVPQFPKFQFLSPTGAPLANGTVTVYQAGTTTLANTWQNLALTTLNTNPIVLDSRGEALVYVDPTATYKFLLKNASASQQWALDDISGVTLLSLPFLQAGTGAVSRTAQDKMRERVSVADFGVRSSQSDSVNVTKLQAAFDYFAGTPVELVVSEPITLAGAVNWRPGISMRREGFGSITAGQAMSTLFTSSLTELIEDIQILGLGIFCDSKANTAFDFQCMRNVLLERVLIEDWLTNAVIAGNALASQTSYELRTSNFHTHRRVAAVPASSRGIYIRAATDCKINNSRIVGGEVGIEAATGGNYYSDVHCWVRASTGLMKRGFVATNADQYYTACYADTPSEYGWYLSQNNHTLANCRVYNNGAVADNTAVGVYFNSADPRSSVVGFQAEGIDGSHRIARDISYLGATSRQSLTVSGNYGYNTVVQESPTSPSISSYTTVTAGGGNGLVTDGAAGTARSATWTTAGVIRWIARVTSTAESGSNAGSNWQLLRRTDAGGVLGTSIDITRSDGTMVMTDGTIQVAGAWQKPFRFGVYSLWVNVTSDKLYIKNGVPSSDTDGTIVGTQT